MAKLRFTKHALERLFARNISPGGTVRKSMSLVRSLQNILMIGIFPLV